MKQQDVDQKMLSATFLVTSPQSSGEDKTTNPFAKLESDLRGMGVRHYEPYKPRLTLDQAKTALFEIIRSQAPFSKDRSNLVRDILINVDVARGASLYTDLGNFFGVLVKKIGRCGTFIEPSLIHEALKNKDFDSFESLFTKLYRYVSQGDEKIRRAPYLLLQRGIESDRSLMPALSEKYLSGGNMEIQLRDDIYVWGAIPEDTLNSSIRFFAPRVPDLSANPFRLPSTMVTREQAEFIGLLTTLEPAGGSPTPEAKNPQQTPSSEPLDSSLSNNKKRKQDTLPTLSLPQPPSPLVSRGLFHGTLPAQSTPPDDAQKTPPSSGTSPQNRG